MSIWARGLGVGRVLGGVSFALPDRSCLGVIGLNGAGKSTLLGLLAGVLVPDEGEVHVPRGAAYLPEGCPLDPGVRARSWLSLARRLPGYEPRFADHLAEVLPLPERTPAGSLSQGQRVRLGLRMTLSRRAPAYILDDPFLGLDPVARRAAESAIAERCGEATTVIAAQDTRAVERLCTHLLLLRAGAVVWFAELDEWRERFRAVRVAATRRGELDGFGAAVRSLRQRGEVVDALLDDPTGELVAALGTTSRPLPLDELIGGVVA